MTAVAHCIPCVCIPRSDLGTILAERHEDFVPTVFDGVDVFILNEKEIEKVQQAGYTIVKSTQTTCQGVVISHIKKNQPQQQSQQPTTFMPSVDSTRIYHGRLPSGQHETREVEIINKYCLTLSERLKQRIVIYNNNGTMCTAGAVNSDTFTIVLGGSPNKGRIRIEGMIFDQEWDMVVEFGYYEAGRPVCIDDTEIAAIDQSNLYIYLPIGAYPNFADRLVIIIETALRVLESPIEDDERIDRLKRNYKRFCEIKHAIDYRKVESEINSETESLERARLNVIESIRRLELLEAKKIAGIKLTKEHSDACMRELDRLLAMKRVKKVRMRGNTSLQVYTDNCYVIHPKTGVEYDIGEMRFSINIESGEIKIFNRTRKVEGYDKNMNAPHVFDGGRICYGNLDRLIPDLLGKNQFEAIVSILISFVETVNIDDAAGSKITCWPVSQRYQDKLAKQNADVAVKVENEPSVLNTESEPQVTAQPEQDGPQITAQQLHVSYDMLEKLRMGELTEYVCNSTPLANPHNSLMTQFESAVAENPSNNGGTNE